MSIKLGVLLSGSGTNLQAIIDRINEGTLDATIELVVSSRPSAYGLKRAEAAGIPTGICLRKKGEDRAEFEAALLDILERHGIDMIVLAGFKIGRAHV